MYAYKLEEGDVTCTHCLHKRSFVNALPYIMPGKHFH